MVEKLITVIVVGVALAWVGYSIYRVLSGKSGCTACKGCIKRDDCSAQALAEKLPK